MFVTVYFNIKVIRKVNMNKHCKNAINRCLFHKMFDKLFRANEIKTHFCCEHIFNLNAFISCVSYRVEFKHKLISLKTRDPHLISKLKTNSKSTQLE